MIQRIQSLYLFLGALSLIVLLFFRGSWQGQAAASFGWFTPAVIGLSILAAVGALGAIFLYENRQRQRSVVVGIQMLTVLLALVLYGGLFLAGGLDVQTEQGVDVGRVVGLLLPVIAYLFFFLARRGITKDIKLVRSMDRLR